jgi:hypothetical protein
MRRKADVVIAAVIMNGAMHIQYRIMGAVGSAHQLRGMFTHAGSPTCIHMLKVEYL